MNAAQAMPPSGTWANEIRIRTSGRADGRAVLEIKDAGVGIPREVVARVFDPFFTTKSVGDGTGLGLSVAQNIIRSMGGSSEIDSEVEIGTVVRVILPGVGCLLDGEPVAGVEADRGPRTSILLVDDEPCILELLGRALRPHDLERAPSGRAALEILGRRQFHVVICDIQMPEVTGMDVHRHLGSLDPDAAKRMIFMTGGTFTSEARDFLDEVPNEVLDEPFGLCTAMSAVDALLSDLRTRRPAA